MGYLCGCIILLITIQQYRTEDACSSKLCVCAPEKVTCIGLNLTYIPKLPAKTKVFIFMQNYLPNISEATFQNISSLKIREMRLRSNSITFFHEDPLKKFQNLKRLDLSSNSLTPESVRNVLYSCNVHRIGGIYLKQIGLTDLPPDAFKGPLVSLLKFVDLSGNNLKFVNLTEFKTLKRLTSLKIQDNHLERITMDIMPNLQKLVVNSNYFRDVPQFCSNGNTFFPRLNMLYLQNNSICEYIPENVECLKKLELLDISFNGIYEVKSNSFSNLPRLDVLKMTNQESARFSIRFEKHAFNNSHLGELLLLKNGILIKYFDELAFAGCHNLRLLEFSYNTLCGYEPENIGKINRVLSPLKKLRILHLAYTNLPTVPTAIQMLPNLQKLNLRGNQITTWPKGTFDSSPNLTMLILNSNKINAVTEDMFSAKVRKQLQSIGLCYNPFRCDCELLWFIRWLNENHQKFIDYPAAYKCVDITERICLNNIAVFKSVTGVSCIIVLVVLIISLIFKFRWSIKYQIYIWRHQAQHIRNLQERQFHYDVFVSYSADDGKWVWDQLAPRLEGENNMKLCVHERDFAAGRLIIDNIVESIEESRHVLIVVSNNFARSDWCQFEMTLAQKHVLNQLMEPLVVVLLEDIENENMSKGLKALLSTTTYLTWNEDPDIAVMFWDKLRRSFRNRH